ncbi:MAG: mechanosensitive ion channel family protein [Candidatus Diapherotrites archaeon]|nr:mechanosensitive ion channel family protein [Candidatus Diapherotrites archaeon]
MVLLVDFAVFGFEILVIAFLGFFLGKFLHKAILLVFKRLTRETKSKLDDFLIEAMEKPLQTIVILLALFFLSGLFANLQAISQAISKYLLSIIIILASFMLSEIFGALLRWYYVEGNELSKFKMDISLLPFVRKISRVVIPLLGISIGLAVIGVDLTGVLAVTSVAVLVLGLASQETLANLFAGLALQLDRPFYYGDFLKLNNDEIARLEKIGLRSAMLEDLNGNKIIISNSEFAKQRITNLSRTYHDSNAIVLIDVPAWAGVKKLVSLLEKKAGAGRIEGLEKKSSFKIYIEKVGKDFFQLGVYFYLKDYEKFTIAKHSINEIALDFLKKKK